MRAKKLANEGYKIAVMSSSGKGRVCTKYKGIGFTGSNLRNEDLKKFIDLIIKSLGRIDVLVNRLVIGPRVDPNITDNDWHKSMECIFVVVRTTRFEFYNEKTNEWIRNIISTFATFEPEIIFQHQVLVSWFFSIQNYTLINMLNTTYE